MQSGDFGRPIGQQRSWRHQHAGVLRACRLGFRHQEQRQNLDGLAQPHVVCKASAQPQCAQQMEPLHAGSLIGPQLCFEARVQDRCRVWIPAGASKPGSAPARDRRTVWRQIGRLRCCRRLPHRGRLAPTIASPQPNDRPSAAARRSICLELFQRALSRSGSTSTHLPRMKARPSECDSNVSISAARQTDRRRASPPSEIEHARRDRDTTGPWRHSWF